MFNRKRKQTEQASITKIMVCRLNGHRISIMWHNKFNKRKTKRKRVKSYVCVTCLGNASRSEVSCPVN